VYSKNYLNLKNGYELKTTITGFLMIGMEFCGEDFFEALENGQIEIGLFDRDDDYEVSL